ncbi:hypothetical protein KUTeg_005414 [Tegillarca granosa]|uniref:NTR domain-containing protein n=1 Tax=Tegillarca granosa TaxID=220873 RepID=A0ABQ9FJQ2_TEGGR|nr:hypothetical protein KUTeg_005414 [Tegillarca granosa]
MHTMGHQINTKITLIVLAIIISMTNIANGCSCLGNIHNQKRFCDSSFVIRGRALSNGQGIAAGNEIEIFTRTNSAACGVYLSTEIEYILAGKVLR